MTIIITPITITTSHCPILYGTIPLSHQNGSTIIITINASNKMKTIETDIDTHIDSNNNGRCVNRGII